LQFEQSSQLGQSFSRVWAQPGNPPANRTGGDEEDLTCDERRFFFRPYALLLLGSPYSLLDSRNKAPSNFLECCRLFSFRVKCQLFQQDTRECGVLAEIFVMRFVDTHELIEQIVMRLRCPKRMVGDGGKFLIEDEKDQVALILRIIEQSPKADVGTPGDLAERGRVVSMPGEKVTRGGTDALTFVQLVLFPESQLRRQNTHSL